MHCKHQLNVDETTDTLLISNKPRIPINQHPVSSLLSLIEKENLICDIVLCPGDLGDKSDEQGIYSSWSFLEEIKLKLNAKFLLGIPGNHDINSRKKLGKEPFAYIKNFHENFPFNEEATKSKFWDLGYCITRLEKTLFLLINTVHDHIDETKAGKSAILPETLEKIKAELSNLNCPEINHKICVLHHHPIKHSNIKNWKDSDSLEKGDDLIQILNQNGFHLVIHGHKHQPRIIEYTSLPIFAAGSFASFANLQNTGIETMFHMVELIDKSRLGTIISWQFDLINGWSHKNNVIFPPRVGFGGDGDVNAIAAKINELFQKNNKKPFFYEEVITSIPDVQFLVPDKLIQLNKVLKETYKIKPMPEYPLEPLKLSEILN